MIAWRRPAVYAAVVAVVVALWFALTLPGMVKPLLLASPSRVFLKLGILLEKPLDILMPIGVTLAETAVAVVCATVLGIILGIVVGRSRLLLAAYEPLVTGLNALPLVILYPILAATLGVGPVSKIALGALYAFFPIVIATMRAVSRVDRGLVLAAQTMGAGLLSITRSVLLPAITSPVIAGLRVAVALALVTIIAAEFISGAAGLGYQLAAASQGLDTPALFAWVLIVIVVTVVVNVFFALITTIIKKGIER